LSFGNLTLVATRKASAKPAKQA